VGLGRAARQHPRPDRRPRARAPSGARPYLKDLPFLADSGYEGAGAGVHVPVKKPARGDIAKSVLVLVQFEHKMIT
jgi:hypothetical protein